MLGTKGLVRAVIGQSCRRGHRQEADANPAPTWSEQLQYNCDVPNERFWRRRRGPGDPGGEQRNEQKQTLKFGDLEIWSSENETAEKSLFLVAARGQSRAIFGTITAVSGVHT